MLDKDEGKLITDRFGGKMPLDVRIVIWLGVISAIIAFLMLGLMLIGIAHIPSDYSRPILFGTFSIDSDLSLGIHTFLIGGISLALAYGIAKAYKLSWWLMLFFSAIGVSDTLLIFSECPVTCTIGLCFPFGIIICLVCRRRLFGIGKGSREVAK